MKSVTSPDGRHDVCGVRHTERPDGAVRFRLQGDCPRGVRRSPTGGGHGGGDADHEMGAAANASIAILPAAVAGIAVVQAFRGRKGDRP